MDTASTLNDPSSKRQRSDSTATLPDDSKGHPIVGPLKEATSFIDNHVKTLQDSLASILSRLAKDHIQLRSKLCHKERQLEKLSNDDSAIPRSAQIKFNLNVSTEAARTAEHKALLDEAEPIIKNVQSELKNLVLKAIKIEIAVMKTQVVEDFARCLYLSCQTFQVGDSVPHEPHVIVATLLDRYATDLLPTLPEKNTPADFRAVYLQKHNLSSIPSPVAQNTPTATTDTSDSLAMQGYIRGLAAPTASSPASTIQTSSQHDRKFAKIKRTIEMLFVEPWNQYRSQEAANQRTLGLKRLEKEIFTVGATEATAMDIDNEPPVEPARLQELIDKSVDKKLKQSKNKPRGQQTDGASKQKEVARTHKNQQRSGRNTNQRSSSRSATSGRGRGRQSNRGGRGAADRNNATGNDDSNNSTRKQRGNSKRNAGRSNAGRSRPARQSRRNSS